MNPIWTSVSGLDTSVSVLFFVAGLVYGFFGWRLIRALVVIDALAIAVLIGLAMRDRVGGDATNSPAFYLAGVLAIALPSLAWKFQRRAAVGFFGLVGFLTAQLFLYDLDMTVMLKLAVGCLAAGTAMALGLSMFRQTTVFMTGVHGAWFVAFALAILAANPGNVVTRMLHSMHQGFSYTLPLSVVVFSVIMIAVQWIDLEGQTAEQYAG